MTVSFKLFILRDWRITMGTQKQQGLTENQVSVLLWLKALNDFKGEGYEDSTFNEKYVAFENVEDTGIEVEEFVNCVDFWIENKVLKRDSESDELSLTEQGEKLFTLIDAKGIQSDEEVKAILEIAQNLAKVKEVIKLVKENPDKVLAFINLCLQAAQIAVTLFIH